MQDLVRRLAWISVARGCGFGALAILTMMVGLVAHPARSFLWGGVGFLLMAGILVAKARWAAHRPLKRTEIWLMLEAHQRAALATMPEVVASIRSHVLLRFAEISATFAAGCLVVATFLTAVSLLGAGG